MFETDEDGNRFFTNLKTLQGYTPIKCTTTTEFYAMQGRTVKLAKESLSPRFGLLYAIYAPPVEGDPLSNKYYIREFREQPNYEEYLKHIWNYIYDGNIYLLFTPADVEDMKATLKRLYKSYHKKEGILDYKLQYLPLLESSITRDFWEAKKKNESGYKTSLMQMNLHIKSIWEWKKPS